MGVRITWNDRNLAEEGHKVYRDTSPMNPLSLPTPIATLGPDITSYDDGDVLVDVTYYYRVSAYVGGIEKVSDEVSVTTTAGTWHPSDLFQSGELGGCWNFNDLSTLFQDTAGASPVTADGQLIARVNDISGNGFNLTQATSTARLVARLGSFNYAEGNSTTGSSARRIEGTLGTAMAYPFTFMVAGDLTGQTVAALGLTGSDTSVTNRCVFALGSRNSDNTGPIIAVYNTSYNDVSIGDSPSKAVNISTFLSGNQYCEDEEGKTSGSLNIAMPSGCTRVCIGGLIRSTSQASYPGNYSCALYINRELTAQEKSDLLTWAMAESNI